MRLCVVRVGKCYGYAAPYPGCSSSDSHPFSLGRHAGVSGERGDMRIISFSEQLPMFIALAVAYAKGINAALHLVAPHGSARSLCCRQRTQALWRKAQSTISLSPRKSLKSALRNILGLKRGLLLRRCFKQWRSMTHRPPAWRPVQPSLRGLR